MLFEDPYFLTSLLEQSYCLQSRHIHDFVKKRYLSWMRILQGGQMLLHITNLLNMGSIPGVRGTYFTFKANINICLNHTSISTSRLQLKLLSKFVNTGTVNDVTMNTVTLLAGLVTRLFLLQAWYLYKMYGENESKSGSKNQESI